jgi:hypothetical protein
MGKGASGYLKLGFWVRKGVVIGVPVGGSDWRGGRGDQEKREGIGYWMWINALFHARDVL